MRNSSHTKYIMLGLLMVVLAGCSTSTVGRQITTSGEIEAYPVEMAPPIEPIDSLAFDFYVNGLLFEGSGDLQSAALSFAKAWERQPQSQEIGLAYAHSLFGLRNYTGALDALNRLDPPAAEALELKALCYRRMGDTNRGRQTYLDLIRIDSTNDVAYMFLADYYRRIRDVDSTIWSLRNLQRLIPGRYEIANELGLMYLAGGNLDMARQEFHHSLELHPAPANTDAMSRLAEIFNQAGQLDSTLNMYNEALEKQPDNLTVNKELADLWIENDSALAALPYLRTISVVDPTDTESRRRLALTYLAADSVITADSVLSALVESGDNDPTNHFYLGRIAILKEDYYRARDELLMVTRDAPSFPDAWMGLGFVYRKLGKQDEEIETFRAALTKMRDESDAVKLYFSLGTAYEQAGQIDSAVAVFEELLDHHPDHSPTLNYLGYTLADRGERLEYARDLIAKAVEMQPQNAAYLDSYGWVYFRLGDYQKAVRYLSEAASLDSDPVIYDHLGDAYHAIGETEKAREWWEKALEQLPDDEAIARKLEL